MAYESVHIDAVLAAVIGEDPVMTADLRHAFLQSANAHVQVMVQSTTVPEWHMAALRFKGLCAAFNIPQLADLAERACVAVKGGPGLLRRIGATLASSRSGIKVRGRNDPQLPCNRMAAR